MKTHVVHIITGLENGGAEGVLSRLCTNDSLYRHTVISLTTEGKYGALLQHNGILVIALGMTKGTSSLAKLLKLRGLIKSLEPDLVQTWMYHSDLLGGIVAKLSGVKNIHWNIRHSNLSRSHNSLVTIVFARLCAWLSRFVPTSIVCCGENAKLVHEALGYDHSKTVVIPNGYVFEEPVENRSGNIRKELCLPPSTPLIGMVARFNPQKNHAGLLQAFSSLNCENAHLALVGPNVTDSNKSLVDIIQSLDIVSRVHLLGERTDIRDFMQALDVHVLSSTSGEGFPNVVAEAMASETPCVVTDVGDAGLIVNGNGWVVSPGDDEALSSAIQAALFEKANNPAKWLRRKKDSALSVRKRFSIQKMIAAYHKVWRDGLKL